MLVAVLALLLSSTLLILSATPPQAPAYTVKEIAGYRLTGPVFDRFRQASHLIAEAIRKDPKLADNPPFTRDVAVLEDVVVAASALDARLREEPALAAALQTSRMTAREYTTFALALFAARLAHGFVQSGAMRFVPEGIARDNVAFVETHERAVAAVLRDLGVEDPAQMLLLFVTTPGAAAGMAHLGHGKGEERHGEGQSGLRHLPRPDDIRVRHRSAARGRLSGERHLGRAARARSDDARSCA
jgi:hypothetical protein